VGELRLALEHHQRAIEVDPTSSNFYLPPANLYLTHGRLDEARSLLTEGLRIVPKVQRYRADRIEIYGVLARIGLIQGDAGARIGALESACELEDHDPELSLELVRAHRAGRRTTPS
jgi:tetratricopeptide (TPR) repeat protein